MNWFTRVRGLRAEVPKLEELYWAQPYVRLVHRRLSGRCGWMRRVLSRLLGVAVDVGRFRFQGFSVSVR